MKVKVHLGAAKTPQGLTSSGLGEKMKSLPRDAGRDEAPKPAVDSRVKVESS